MEKRSKSLEERLNLPTAPSVPWTVGDVVWGLLFFMVWLGSFVLISLIGEMLQLTLDSGLVIIFGEMILLLPAWYFTIRKHGASWADLGLRGFQPQAVGIGCGLMAAAFILNLGYALALDRFGLRVQPDIAIVFKETNYPLVLFVGGGLIAPFVEEVFFRGFVFPGLRRKWGWPRAAVASAALFAIAHVLPTSLLPIFVLGLIFAFLYQYSGSIWPAVLMHVLTNTLALSAAYAASQGWMPPS